MAISDIATASSQLASLHASNVQLGSIASALGDLSAAATSAQQSIAQDAATLGAKAAAVAALRSQLGVT